MGFLNEPRLGCSFSNGRNWKDSGGMMWPHVTTLVPVPANCRCKQILDIYDDDNNIYIYIFLYRNLCIFIYMVKRGWQFDIIQRANYLSGTLGSWDVYTCYSFFPSTGPTVKDMPQDVDDDIGDMKRMICWHDVQNRQGNTKKHMLPKDTFCTSDIFCMVFPSILVALYSTYV